MAIAYKNSRSLEIQPRLDKSTWNLDAQNIREEERTRIAREIHDELGQWLTALKIEAFLIKKTITADDTATQQQLSSMIALVIETEKAVERIATELRPSILDNMGLVAALEWHGKEFERRTGIQSQILSKGDLNLEINRATSILRVYQESLTNVARHANATIVDTVIEQKDKHVILIIKDNGIGFDMSEVKMEGSLGLIGMKERALLFDGELSIKSSKSNGTVIRLEVPLDDKCQQRIRHG